MGKTVYSIVLDDDVVEAIDAMAYRLGTNRSGLINSILAEKVALITPEQKRKLIINTVEGVISQQDIFRILQNDNNLTIKSSFKYKYNPSVKYTVILHKDIEYLGELRVTMRTQNESLLLELENFLQLWSAMEKKYLKGRLSKAVTFSIERGKYTRQLAYPKQEMTESQLGEVISDYIQGFDRIIKLYFTNKNSRQAEQEYVMLLNNSKGLI